MKEKDKRKLMKEMKPIVAKQWKKFFKAEIKRLKDIQNKSRGA